MTTAEILSVPFVQISLPIMITFAAGIWMNNRGIDAVRKRIDDLKSDMNLRFLEVVKRLDKIDATLGDHDQRIARIDECTSLVGRR
jgi:hypothetical protein